MARSSKIIGFSLPPEINIKLEQYASEHYKTRSELLREMIESYFAGEKPNLQTSQSSAPLPELLQQLSSAALDETIVIIGLAIVKHPKRRQILICERQGDDKFAPGLSWAFPGAAIGSLQIKQSLNSSLKARLGVDVTINQVISARVFPGSVEKQIINLYFGAAIETTDNISLDPAKYQRSKWIAPEDVYRYFTTSVSDEITDYLIGL